MQLLYLSVHWMILHMIKEHNSSSCTTLDADLGMRKLKQSFSQADPLSLLMFSKKMHTRSRTTRPFQKRLSSKCRICPNLTQVNAHHMLLNVAGLVTDKQMTTTEIAIQLMMKIVLTRMLLTTLICAITSLIKPHMPMVSMQTDSAPMITKVQFIVMALHGQQATKRSPHGTRPMLYFLSACTIICISAATWKISLGLLCVDVWNMWVLGCHHQCCYHLILMLVY